MGIRGRRACGIRRAPVAVQISLIYSYLMGQYCPFAIDTKPTIDHAEPFLCLDAAMSPPMPSWMLVTAMKPHCWGRLQILFAILHGTNRLLQIMKERLLVFLSAKSTHRSAEDIPFGATNDVPSVPISLIESSSLHQESNAD